MSVFLSIGFGKKGEKKMKFTPPKQITFWIAVVLAALGLIASLVTIPVLSGIAFWLVLAGFILLALSLLIKGL
jgi:heme/copper-type cytochrome/quinol oxidase subunit 1